VGTSKITGRQGSHNKPIGCGASGAYAPGPDDEEEEEEEEDISSDLVLLLLNDMKHVILFKPAFHSPSNELIICHLPN
jgi:hypothetical protein